MGGWLEVLRQKPPDGADDYSRRLPLIVGEYACHPLVKAIRYLGREHRGTFPALARVCVDSPAYHGESLWLDDRQSGELLAEFRRVRRIGRWQEFLAGLDGRRYYDLWREGKAPEEFEAHLDRIEALLAAAEGGGWVHLSL
jgi:hypothetical protein